MSAWAELTVRASSPAELAIAEALASSYALRGTAIDMEPPALRAWFSHDERESVTALRAALTLALPTATVTIDEIADSAWEHAWRKHFSAQRVGEIAIVPSWERAAFHEPARAIVELDPGQAFGTGLHPTTRACLLHLQELAPAGRSLTDVGTGSGILAIAAALLGAACVYACDVDPVAVRAARENVQRNGVADRVRVERCAADLAGVPPAEIVVANLTADLIVGLAAALRARMRSGGILLLAGVVSEREHEVQAALAVQGLRTEVRRTHGEWVSLCLR